MKNDLDNIKTLTLAKIAESRIKAKEIIEEMEAKKQILDDEIIDRLKIIGTNGTDVTIQKTKWYVFYFPKYSFPDVTIKQADELGALEKRKNVKKLTRLYKRGAKIKANVRLIVSVREEKP